ncbi:hypothetical protein B0H13DRAFT_2279670 [Mycena leptocephala]|nr:hypothetical protein B0H13DRAFT_2279670 [Mycena leptocephala]
MSHHIIHTGGRERKVVARGWAVQRSIEDEVSVPLYSWYLGQKFSAESILGGLSMLQCLLYVRQFHSKFRDVDIEARTYNAQKPYGHPFYQDVITKRFFFAIPTAEGVRAIPYELFVDLKQQSRATEMELTPRGQN